MRIAVLRGLILSALTLVSALVLAGEPIKKTGSGLCHPVTSSYYERITSFEAYPSINACLETGGRLPKGVQSRAATQASDKYRRPAFGHGWADLDGDGQDARAEILIASSTVAVTFATDDRKRVIRGRWISPFTGNVIVDAAEIEADHVVPLKFAWDRGASEWSAAKRKRFANDPINILPVEAGLNSQKQDRGPAEWLPPAGQCGYIARFLRVSKIYGIEFSAEEEATNKALRAQCARRST